MRSEKMKAKYMKGDVWKSFFINLQVNISQLHYKLTSSQIICRYCNIASERPRKATSRSFIKCLKSTCEMYVLYVLVEILQLVHEISSSSGFTYKRAILKNFSNFTDKHDKKSSAGILSKNVFKNFAKLRERYLRRNLFFNKVTGWKPKTIRSSHWRYSVKRYY